MIRQPLRKIEGVMEVEEVVIYADKAGVSSEPNISNAHMAGIYRSLTEVRPFDGRNHPQQRDGLPPAAIGRLRRAKANSRRNGCGGRLRGG